MDVSKTEKIFNALETFRIELPSWASPIPEQDLESLFSPPRPLLPRKNSATPARCTAHGVCPTVALHVLWDCPEGVGSTDTIKKFAERYRVLPGAINPNLFQDQEYKFGSFGNPDPAIRQRALQHTKDSIEIARRLHSRDISMWFATDRITRHGEHQAAQAMVHRGAEGIARRVVADAAPADRVQTIRTCLLPY